MTWHVIQLVSQVSKILKMIHKIIKTRDLSFHVQDHGYLIILRIDENSVMFVIKF